jgi:hypothetical protein
MWSENLKERSYLRHIGLEDIVMKLKDVGCEHWNRIPLDHYRVQCWAVVNKLLGPIKIATFVE